MYSKVLLAIDCWPESRAAIDATKKLIRGTPADVLVLHVRERQYARSFVWEPGLPGDARELVDCTVYELARLADDREGGSTRHGSNRLRVPSGQRRWPYRFSGGVAL
jgi:hypothetical protein